MKKTFNSLAAFFYGGGMGASFLIIYNGEASRLEGVIIFVCILITYINRLINKHYET